VFILSLIPIVGPPLGLLWGSYALAFQQTDAALARRGLDFGERRAWHRYWKLESMGFGITGLLTLIVPSPTSSSPRRWPWAGRSWSSSWKTSSSRPT
jgi:uncharacterized protein involved in cysteine biosynthesis